jgi:2-hydroxychromene-2-carboxylate isomerase
VIIGKRIKGKAIAAWLGPTGDAARRAVQAIRHTVTSAPRKLDFYFDIADPWSYLAAQAAKRLVDAYGVELAFHVVTPPASDVTPQPELRDKHAVRDAQLMAEYWDLDFPGKKEADPGALRDVGTALVRERPAAEQLECALGMAAAMWANDRKQLAKLLGTWGTESHGSVAPILNAKYADLRKAGHYQGAMFQYDGEWYWGIDRLIHLEAALARDTARPRVTDPGARHSGAAGEVAGVVTPRPESERGAKPLSDKDLSCEMWFSFRSPYSYLALEQIEDVLAPYGVPLELKPILPMVNRGAQLPQVKKFYIVRDAKREADRKNIAFGDICDPLGKGIENAIALAYFAATKGRLLELARSVMRGSWAEARDLAEYVDLRYVAERAGLPWNEAKDALTDPEAQKWAKGNAADLGVIGLWGVPSFRIGDFVAWGQDRLPLLTDRLRRHRLSRNPS